MHIKFIHCLINKTTMKTFRLILFALAISVSTALFAQTTNAPTPESKFQDIVIADYNNMNLGPKLNHLPQITITSITDRANLGGISPADFISTWMLYQTDVKKMNLATYQSLDSAMRTVYDNANAFVYQNELPTVLEILAFCKK